MNTQAKNKLIDFESVFKVEVATFEKDFMKAQKKYENIDRYIKEDGKEPDSFSFAVDMTDTGEDRLIKFYEEQQNKEDD